MAHQQARILQGHHQRGPAPHRHAGKPLEGAAVLAASPLRPSSAVLAALRSGDAPVVVIGPSGWLGSAALALLDQVFSREAYADAELAGRLLVFGSHGRPVTLPSGRRIDCQALERLGSTDLAGAVILHFAYLTKDKTSFLGEDAFIRANDAIQDQVEAALATASPAGLFFASSGGVYQGRDPGAPTREENLYGWMKLRHEARFAAAATRAGVALLNGRIFTVAGEYVNKHDLYALADILVALRDRRPVELKARVEVWRSYAYVGDIVNLALALLLKGETHAFDMAGDTPVEIGDLARLCRDVTGRRDVAIERPPLTGGAANRMIGDHAAYYALMMREGIEPVPLRAQIAATAAYLGVR